MKIVAQSSECIHHSRDKKEPKLYSACREQQCILEPPRILCSSHYATAVWPQDEIYLISPLWQWRSHWMRRQDWVQKEDPYGARLPTSFVSIIDHKLTKVTNDLTVSARTSQWHSTSKAVLWVHQRGTLHRLTSLITCKAYIHVVGHKGEAFSKHYATHLHGTRLIVMDGHPEFTTLFFTLVTNGHLKFPEIPQCTNQQHFSTTIQQPLQLQTSYFTTESL